jgi:hypothetical protein
MSSFLRPNIATVDRQAQAGVSLTGEPKRVGITTVYGALPCMIDSLPVGSKTGGDLQLAVEGVVYIATDVGFFDGLGSQKIPVGKNPGDMFTYNGVAYKVSGNGRGAYPDILPSDRITDERGRPFLVLATAQYYDILPNMQVRLAFGRAWK